jgi:hypothetical protein
MNRKPESRDGRSRSRPLARHPFRRPVVPARDEQRLDTDYDPDPATEATPLKNAPQG